MKRNTILFLLVILLLIPSTNAIIDYNVFSSQVKNVSNFTELDNVEIVFHLTNDEVIQLNDQSFDPITIYCWENCNIYPTIGVSRIDITQDNEIIAAADSSISNLLDSSLLNYTQTIVTYPKEKQTALSSIPNNLLP